MFILYKKDTILNGIVKRSRFGALASVDSSIFFKGSILIMTKSSPRYVRKKNICFI